MSGTQGRKMPAECPRRETGMSWPAGPQNMVFAHGAHSTQVPGAGPPPVMPLRAFRHGGKRGDRSRCARPKTPADTRSPSPDG